MLKPERFYLFRSRTNEADTGIFALGRKLGVLTQKSVSGMDRLAARVFRDRKNLRACLDSSAWPGPVQFGTIHLPEPTCIACASASEKTETAWMPSLRKVRITRQAISPRLATRTLVNMESADPCRSAQIPD